ncbi:MAG: cytochrome c [Sphingomonadaceae bacterium]
MGIVRTLVVAAAVAAAPAMVLANVATTIQERQENFKAIGRANKAIQDELKRPRPSADVIRTNAAALERASQQIPRFFPAGSGPEAGVKTEALPAIWKNPAGFADAAEKNLAAARALKAAADSGDMARIRATAEALGPTCKTCHDQFRGKS